MATYYKSRYRNESIRLRTWDYFSKGFYFITLFVHKRAQVFGRIEDGLLILSPSGLIALEKWIRSIEIRTDFIFHEFVIMPNHIHGIIQIIHGPKYYHTMPKKPYGVAFRRPKSISTFVACYKSIVTKRINQMNKTLCCQLWQPQFYEYIIRDENALRNIKFCIRNNPRKWSEDRFNKKKISD